MAPRRSRRRDQQPGVRRALRVEDQNAIESFKRNVEASSNSANAYDSLADGYAKAGMWKKAVRASERSVELAIEFDLPNTSYFKDHARKMNDRLKQESDGTR